MRRSTQKIIAIFTSVIVSLSMIVLPVNAEEDIRVFLDGQKISFDVPPQIINDYTMVPMRAIFEALGYNVDWNDADKSITAVNGSNTIFMKLLSNEMTYNEDVITLDIAPMSVDGRTLVPVRAISETSGYNVSWDGTNRSVVIGVASAVSYYDATNEIEQINSLIEQGLYLEASNMCNSTISNYNISENDKESINNLRDIAQKKYSNYLSYNEQFMTYCRDDWGMTFKIYKDITPVSYGDTFDTYQSIEVYNSGAPDWNIISINSNDIGVKYQWGSEVSNINTVISDLVAWYNKLSLQGYNYGVDFDILSESDTMVGSIPARQATFRIATYMGRYNTNAQYEIRRVIAFKYGDWIYTIDAHQNEYNWTEDFWDKLELVRTTIGFRG